MRVSEYFRAAEMLESEGEPVTVQTLAQTSGIEAFTIRQFLHHHPGAAEMIGVESYAQHMQALYLAAAILIRVTRPADNSGARTSELCRMLSFHAPRVRYFLRKYPDLAKEIGWIDDWVPRESRD